MNRCTPSRSSTQALPNVLIQSKYRMMDSTHGIKIGIGLASGPKSLMVYSYGFVGVAISLSLGITDHS